MTSPLDLIGGAKVRASVLEVEVVGAGEPRRCHPTRPGMGHRAEALQAPGTHRTATIDIRISIVGAVIPPFDRGGKP